MNLEVLGETSENIKYRLCHASTTLKFLYTLDFWHCEAYMFPVREKF